MRYLAKPVVSNPHVWLVLDLVTRTLVRVGDRYTLSQERAIRIARTLNEEES